MDHVYAREGFVHTQRVYRPQWNLAINVDIKGPWMQTEVGLVFLYLVLHTCVTSRSRVTYCGKFLGMLCLR
mgnify:CR=1 FL=1